MLQGNANRLLQDYAARIEKLTKRVDRLETLEFSSAAFPSSGGMVCIETVKLAAPAASVTLPTPAATIPATWWHLWIWLSAHMEEGIDGTVALLRFNGDAGANYLSYYNQWVRNAAGVDTTASAGGTGNTNQITTMSIAGNQVGENEHRHGCEINVYDYAAEDMFKTVTWKGWKYNPPDGQELVMKAFGGGEWKSLAAITSITFSLLGGFSFDTGSVFSLFALCSKPA